MSKHKQHKLSLVTKSDRAESIVIAAKGATKISWWTQSCLPGQREQFIADAKARAQLNGWDNIGRLPRRALQ